MSITNKCIILDLDETCIHSFTYMDKLDKLNIMKDSKYLDIRRRIYKIKMLDIDGDRDGSGKHAKMWGVERPYLKEFLTFCFSYFDIVAVWSAGVYKYVHEIVRHIFKDIGEPHIIFTREDCKVEKDGNLTKPISKMIEKVNEMNKFMNTMNTFIVDDRFDTFQYNYNNGILIPPYNPKSTIKGLREGDKALLRFMTWLTEKNVHQSIDIRSLEKDRIFNLPASRINYDNLKHIEFPDNLHNYILKKENMN
uniref:Ctd-like (NLI interacting factor-like) phosphatase n=1 Tax=Pithovirus LCPAC101 TaxID=2506586 RepID=A0A481Z3K0_9VIRU|nr:MAG: ctd-like (NLI interacting factor-like) phosphatase [Pithovirus LCPAC101]